MKWQTSIHCSPVSYSGKTTYTPNTFIVIFFLLLNAPAIILNLYFLFFKVVFIYLTYRSISVDWFFFFSDYLNKNHIVQRFVKSMYVMLISLNCMIVLKINSLMLLLYYTASLIKKLKIKLSQNKIQHIYSSLPKPQSNPLGEQSHIMSKLIIPNLFSTYNGSLLNRCQQNL